MSELNHRMKNTLAVVQSIAQQTHRSTRSREDFIDRFTGRLLALGRAHSLLSDSDWKGADLATLARQQLEPYISDDPPGCISRATRSRCRRNWRHRSDWCCTSLPPTHQNMVRCRGRPER